MCGIIAAHSCVDVSIGLPVWSPGQLTPCLCPQPVVLESKAELSVTFLSLKLGFHFCSPRVLQRSVHPFRKETAYVRG